MQNKVIGVLEERVRPDEGQIPYGNCMVVDVLGSTCPRTSKLGVPEE